MKVEKIQSIITPRTTGYASLAGFCLAAASTVSERKSLRKIHKPIGWISVGLAALHVGLIEYYNHKYKM